MTAAATFLIVVGTTIITALYAETIFMDHAS